MYYRRLFEHQADLFKAMAHPRRLEILQLLRESSLIVTDIFSMLDLPQANVSQHLKILKDAGIVTVERKGKLLYYTLADKSIRKLMDVCRAICFKAHADSLPFDSSSLPDMLLPTVEDVVCGMHVSVHTAGDATRYQGKTYFFCASGCKEKFLQNPSKFLTTDHILPRL